MTTPHVTENKVSPVLKVEDLAVAYKVRGGEIEAVQNVSFDIHRGESHGIVGESGCGKSTVAWAIVNFLGNNGYVKRGHIKVTLFRYRDIFDRCAGSRGKLLPGNDIGVMLHFGGEYDIAGFDISLAPTKGN